MPEDVQTGGLMSFKYFSESNHTLSDEKKKEIREAYARADERKRREKRNKMIIWMIVLLIVVLLIGVGFYFFR